MKRSNAPAKLFVTVALFAMGVALFAANLAAQDTGWQVLRAEYGFRNQRTDVTDLLRNLLSRGGVNGVLAVNNQTMGGDPAVGKDKQLRIFARNRANQDREFDYNEGGFVPVAMFMVGRDDHDEFRRNERGDGRGEYRGGREGNDSRGLKIVRGFYGVQGRTANVTDLLQRMVRDGLLTVNVNNRQLGGDPAVGADKVLIVVYMYQGKEQATSVAEGSTLSIP